MDKEKEDNKTFLMAVGIIGVFAFAVGTDIGRDMVGKTFDEYLEDF